ncbi:MAG TPA: 23S rRNA (adenine(2503)-C(2))-methyltransferase RlmN [Bacteroidota bacterium]|nr:23S rRNA (adenine(2503)-C(2))-methyltransferase RlmN [Bacteroidota bacterium]
MKKTNLRGLTLPELEDFSASIGEQIYRGKQLFEWIYRKGASSFAGMTSLSAALRKKLESAAALETIGLIGQQRSISDGTTKFLFQLSDGGRIESVLIPPRTAFRDSEASEEEEQKRLTLCVSTQVGCPLDCKFCATATMGFLRNLTSGEIIDQLRQVKEISNRRITNVVYMGMGEPLLNYENVMKSIDIISTGMSIAARRITVSTAGWAPKIRQMADEGRRVKLAISLHTLDPRARSELMPINHRFGLDELVDAAEYYYRKIKQRITFEYILFAGWNDREEDAAALVKLSKKVPCKINIIPFHSIAFTKPQGLAASLHASPKRRAEAFVRRLREAHLSVFVRSSAGEDIAAACGQLAVEPGAARPDGKAAVNRAVPRRSLPVA